MQMTCWDEGYGLPDQSDWSRWAEWPMFPFIPQELKRKSRDIETETEEELFVTLPNTSPETAGTGSASISPSEQSASTDYIEEVTSDIPFEGKIIPVRYV